MEIGINGFWQAIKDTCFPPLCLACGNVLPDRGEFFFCVSCLRDIVVVEPPICHRCGRSFPGGRVDHLCGLCLVWSWNFSRARALVSYQGPLATAIRSFKYGGSTAGLSSFVAMKRQLFSGGELAVPDLIVPVPLHPGKLRQRGFNQALVLARAFFPDQRRKIDPFVLQRTRATLPQAGLSRLERKKNIKGAFRVRFPEKIKGRTILLIDDVFTTGATVDECAGTLVRARAREVQVLTLARVDI